MGHIGAFDKMAATYDTPDRKIVAKHSAEAINCFYILQFRKNSIQKFFCFINHFFFSSKIKISF